VLGFWSPGGLEVTKQPLRIFSNERRWYDSPPAAVRLSTSSVPRMRRAIRLASYRLVVEGSAFVVAEARLIVRVEDFGHKLSATVYGGLVEDTLQVFLDGVH
jgi:hypothetical protein